MRPSFRGRFVALPRILLPQMVTRAALLKFETDAGAAHYRSSHRSRCHSQPCHCSACPSDRRSITVLPLEPHERCSAAQQLCDLPLSTVSD
jgi:hypothetical protein